jgi:hypothetical protein
LAKLRGSRLLEKCGREKMGREGRWVERWRWDDETEIGGGSCWRVVDGTRSFLVHGE